MASAAGSVDIAEIDCRFSMHGSAVSLRSSSLWRLVAGSATEAQPSARRLEAACLSAPSGRVSTTPHGRLDMEPLLFPGSDALGSLWL
ncbi:hypothetical protein WJX77_012047 [Trebouxia sp. C0004]